MPVLVRIALRNLLEHKAKSLIIGILLALGVVILVVGNAFMDTAARGVKDTFIGNYTADVFIHANSKFPVSLFGVQAAGGMEETKSIPEYERVMALVAKAGGSIGTAGQVTGYAIVSPRDSEKQSFAMLFGVDPASYYRIFDNAKVVEGRLMAPGEKGFVISRKQAEDYGKDFGRPVKAGDELLLTGIGKAGFKIQAVPVTGIIEYKTETEATDFISYVDVDTARVLQGMTLGDDEETVVSEEQKALLAEDDEEALFGGEEFVAASTRKAAPVVAAAKAAPRPAAVDRGAWHFQLVRLADPGKAGEVIAGLNAAFAAEGIDARASDWKAAAGPFAKSIDVVRIVFNIAIIIVAVVAVIIMTNTLVISVIERTGEIGTMRALGAQRGFVRRMFLVETLTIAAVFGSIGVALSAAVVGILNALKIEAGNAFLQILFAGKVLRAEASLSSIAWSLVLVGIVAVVAHLYPVSLALKVEPVRAMQTE